MFLPVSDFQPDIEIVFATLCKFRDRPPRVTVKFLAYYKNRNKAALLL